MSERDKVISEISRKLYDEYMVKGPYLNWHSVEEAIGRAYDAGKVETPDEDAARWRMFMIHFGDQKANYQRDWAFFPPMPARFNPDEVPEVMITRGAKWRLDCHWVERTGNADTIQKFIDLMLASRKENR